MPDYALPTTGAGFGFEPRGRISPFFDCVNAAGGRNYHRHLNTYIAYEFGDGAEAQYKALHEAATLVDVSTLHVIQVQGPGALAFVDHLVTRDIRKMQPGRSAYVFTCDQNGTVIADPVMLIVDAETVWLTVGTVDLELWVKGVAVNTPHDVVVTTVPAPPVQVSGPKALQILKLLTDYPLEAMKPYRCARLTLAGLDVLVSTTGYSGELSYEVYLIGAEPYPYGRDLGNRLWRAIRDAGAPHGLLESPVMYSRATEAGFITISHTARDRMCALEFWRPSMVDFSGGDFIGKAKLQEIRDTGGPPRRMMGLATLQAGETLTTGEWEMPFYAGGVLAGTTRRTSYSRHLDRGIAIALVNRAFAVPGARFTLPHGSGIAEVEAVELPFVPTKRASPTAAAGSVGE